MELEEPRPVVPGLHHAMDIGSEQDTSIPGIVIDVTRHVQVILAPQHEQQQQHQQQQQHGHSDTDTLYQSLSASMSSSALHAVPGLPGFSWAKKLLRLERAYILAEYKMAVLNTLGGAYAATNRTAQALMLSAQKEAVAAAHPSASPRMMIQARIHSAINIGLLGDTRASKRMIQQCMRHARAQDAPDLVDHSVTSYTWMCGELVRKGKCRFRVKGRVCAGASAGMGMGEDEDEDGDGEGCVGESVDYPAVESGCYGSE